MHIARLGVVTLISFALSACLESQKTVELDVPTEQLTLSGSVGDGPVVNAEMQLVGSGGGVLLSFMSDANAHYQVTVDVATDQFPLTVEASGGIDLVTMLPPDFLLESVVLEGGDIGVVNLNPFTTMIVALAESLPGGINNANLATAEGFVVSALNSGLVTFDESGVVKTPIDDSNIAEMVKSSETLGELLRRTGDRMNDAGFQLTIDDLVATIASDLSDGLVDGRGGPEADEKVSAVATVVYAQVLMEAMTNELHVLGEDATSAMNDAIRRIGSSPDAFVEDQKITAGMIQKARIGVAAAYEVTGDPALERLHSAISGLKDGMDPSIVRLLLPSDYRFIMGSLLANVASADSTTVDLINEIARGDGSIAAPPPPTNAAPEISGSPAGSVEAGQSYAFTPTASDPDGDVLIFSVSNLPSWAGFDSSTGAISGTPGDGAVGNYTGIEITVSDGELTDSLAAFSIEVTLANVAPQISGVPPDTIIAGQSFSFTPDASDADGDALTFSVSNLPSWAEFDTSSGNISGTPGDGDVGSYSSIRVTVSDGQETASIQFAIDVEASSVGALRLSWTPPTENSDNSALTDLTGYRIYWGTTPGDYTNSVTIDNAGVSSYVIENLAPGTYEFVATAVNSDGVESALSEPATGVVR